MKDYQLNLQSPVTFKSKKDNKRAILTLTIFILVVFLLFASKLNFGFKKQERKEVMSAQDKNQDLPTLAPTKQKSVSDLFTLLEKEISAYDGTYSIYIYDLKQKKGFGINEKTIFNAASVSKIAILASLYNLASKNEIDLEKNITIQAKDIRDYGTGVIRYDKPGTSYSLKTLARLMMEKSDNTAAYVLANPVIGLKKIQQLVESWGLSQTDMITNKSSNIDMAKLLVMMYQGEIASEALTAEMLNFMDKSDFDDRLPTGLPTGITIYHKTGDFQSIVHDAGIVDLAEKPYYLGVFTMDITDEKLTKQRLAYISRLVYGFMKDSL